ncbi:hypothetical protein HYT59_01195 [Candidatus Woesebacteria bacterium]|nr:hypothetical protein [Candidatus Woesebacteria bacterium]
MQDSFRSIIDSAHEILILLPQNPNLDQVAAGLGLYLSLVGEKSTFISSPSPMTMEFNRLIGVNKIKDELGGRNLTIKLVDYPAKNIEKVSYDIVNDEFRLVVVPKDGMNPPGSDLVHLSYSGAGADTVILIGGTKDSDFPVLSSNELGQAKKVHVGTRQLETTSDLGILSFARPASSNSELIASLIKETTLKMDADIATNLLAGVQKATGSFSNPEITPDTLEISAYLMRSGAKRELPEMARPRFPFPPGSIPGQFETLRKARDITAVETAPRADQGQAPKDWLQPKIFTGNKGTSIS